MDESFSMSDLDPELLGLTHTLESQSLRQFGTPEALWPGTEVPIECFPRGLAAEAPEVLAGPAPEQPKERMRGNGPSSGMPANATEPDASKRLRYNRACESIPGDHHRQVVNEAMYMILEELGKDPAAFVLSAWGRVSSCDESVYTSLLE